MAKNLRKGSKVFISVSGRGFKRTPAVVTSKQEDDVVVKVTSGFVAGKSFSRRVKEVKKRSK